eukprot:XP_001704902.1 Hypothetical protein GL50803_37264 [Giardia lamblia ATCC 50803]
MQFPTDPGTYCSGTQSVHWFSPGPTQALQLEWHFSQAPVALSP